MRLRSNTPLCLILLLRRTRGFSRWYFLSQIMQNHTDDTAVPSDVLLASVQRRHHSGTRDQSDIVMPARH